MKPTGIALIAQERKEQIEKHARTIEWDVDNNKFGQLNHAAATLLFDGTPMVNGLAVRLDTIPDRWNAMVWKRMAEKPYKDRLIIAGALIAAEIDRLQALEG